MKKLLTILTSITFVGSGSIPLVSCHHPAADEKMPPDVGTSQDAKILNDITNEINNYLLKYLKDYSLINSQDYGQGIIQNIFNRVDKNQPSIILKDNDMGAKQAFDILKNSLKNYFDEINRKIKQEYSNVYIDNYPINYNFDGLNFILNFIDIETLKTLSPSVGDQSVNSVNINCHLSYNIHYKKLKTQSNFNLQWIVTDNPEMTKELQKGVILKLSKEITTYFNQGNILIDQNPAFKGMYDNFDINYTTDYARLDGIIEAQLKDRISNSVDLKEVKDQIVWNPNQSILSLLSGAIDETTNGIGIADPALSSDHWAGTGFQPEQITPENFLKFYMQILKVFHINSNELQLANFNINLSKITVAGMPLSGTIINGGEPLNIIISISKTGLDQKLTNFANIITSFMKHYRVESASDHWTIHLTRALFLKIKEQKYNDALAEVTNDFVNDHEDGFSNLADINLFTLGNETKHNHAWAVRDEHTIGINKKWVWNFDFMFGNKKVDNSICYTPVTSWHFYLDFKDDLSS